MDDAALIEHSLALVAERVGDPAPLVYARLFEAFPELEALFVRDVSGMIRGNMLTTTLECPAGALGHASFKRREPPLTAHRSAPALRSLRGFYHRQGRIHHQKCALRACAFERRSRFVSQVSKA